METLEALALALIQGVTEFLPISSSGHLILTPALFGWSDPGLAYDIAVHLGTLVAVVIYFRRELRKMALGFFDLSSHDGRVGRQLIVASIPLGLAGLFGAGFFETVAREPWVISVAGIVFGVVLWLVDWRFRGKRSVIDLSRSEALLIGLGQALALIPGTSRSGISMTVALALGLSREAASRFAFLLSIPAISMAAGWQSYQFARAPETLHIGQLLPATVLAGLTAYLAIALFLRLISRIGMGVFAIYRIVLAVVTLYVLA